MLFKVASNYIELAAMNNLNILVKIRPPFQQYLSLQMINVHNIYEEKKDEEIHKSMKKEQGNINVMHV